MAWLASARPHPHLFWPRSSKVRFPDGNLFLNLKGTTKSPLSPSEAMAQVIHSYYPPDRLPKNENELQGLYHSVLAGKHALLLLDNAADKEQVAPLFPPKRLRRFNHFKK